MGGSFDPYHRWLGIPPKDQPPNHYRLLGIELFEPDADVVDAAADRQMGHVRKYQTGEHSKLSQGLLNELAAARVCLLSPQKRIAYDKRLKARLEKAHAVSRSVVTGSLKKTPSGKAPPPLPARSSTGAVAAASVVPSAGPEKTKSPGANRRTLGVALGAVAAGLVVAAGIIATQSDDTSPDQTTSETVVAHVDFASRKPGDETSAGGETSSDAGSPPSDPGSDATSVPPETSLEPGATAEEAGVSSTGQGEDDDGDAAHPSVEAVAETPPTATAESTGGAAPKPIPPSRSNGVDPPETSAEFREYRSFPVENAEGAWIVPRRPSLFVAQQSDFTLTLYNLQSCSEEGRLPLGDNTPGRHRALSPDGRYFAACTAVDQSEPDSRVCIWSFDKEISSGAIEKPGCEAPAFVEFAQGNELLTVFLSDEYEQAVLRDPDTGRMRRQFSLADKAVDQGRIERLSPAVSPGGQFLALVRNCPACRRLEVFDVSLGKRVATSPLPEPALGPEEGEFLGLSFSADGCELTALLAGGPTCRLRTWDLATGKTAADFEFTSNIPIERRAMASVGVAPSIRMLDPLPDNSGWLIDGRVLVDRVQERPAVDLPAGSSVSFLGSVGENGVLCVSRRKSDCLLKMHAPSIFRTPDLVRTLVEPVADDSPPDEEPAPRVGGLVREKQPVPTQSVLKEAQETVRRQYSRDYAVSKSPRAHAVLAQRLIDASGQLPQGSPKRYVLLEDARRQAILAGNAQLAASALDPLTDEYEIDCWRLRIETLEELCRTTRDDPNRKALVAKCYEFFTAAVKEDRYEKAEQIALKAVSIANRRQDMGDRQRTRIYLKRVQSMKSEWEALQLHWDTLKAAPGDRTANLKVGLFYCCMKDDWQKGSEHLAQSSDRLLREAAQLELQAKAQVNQVPPVKLADAWYAAAFKRVPRERRAMLLRAKFWYVVALPLAKAQQRVVDIDAQLATLSRFLR